MKLMVNTKMRGLDLIDLEVLLEFLLEVITPEIHGMNSKKDIKVNSIERK
jgi:hypothetical protein